MYFYLKGIFTCRRSWEVCNVYKSMYIFLELFFSAAKYHQPPLTLKVTTAAILTQFDSMFVVSLILQWHWVLVTITTSPYSCRQRSNLSPAGVWHHPDTPVIVRVGRRARWHSHLCSSTLISSQILKDISRKPFVSPSRLSICHFLPPHLVFSPRPLFHSFTPFSTSQLFRPPCFSTTCTHLLKNTDSTDRSCTGPISWVLLTTGTHLITAETEVGGRTCQSLSLDQCGPSPAVLWDGDGEGGTCHIL